MGFNLGFKGLSQNVEEGILKCYCLWTNSVQPGLKSKIVHMFCADLSTTST